MIVVFVMNFYLPSAACLPLNSCRVWSSCDSCVFKFTGGSRPHLSSPTCRLKRAGTWCEDRFALSRRLPKSSRLRWLALSAKATLQPNDDNEKDDDHDMVRDVWDANLGSISYGLWNSGRYDPLILNSESYFNTQTWRLKSKCHCDSSISDRLDTVYTHVLTCTY